MSDTRQPVENKPRSQLAVAAIAIALLCFVVALGIFTGNEFGAWPGSEPWLVRLGIYGGLITGGLSLFAARYFARSRRGRPWEIM